MNTLPKIEALLPAHSIAARSDLAPGVPIDAMEAAISHVQSTVAAVEVLLGEGCEDRPSDHILSVMLAGVETHLAVLSALCNHAYQTSQERAGGDS